MTLGEFFAECGMLFKERQKDYRDAWKKMTPLEIASGLRLKAGRICAMLENGGSLEKILDDLKDLSIYAGILHLMLTEIMKSPSSLISSSERGG